MRPLMGHIINVKAGNAYVEFSDIQGMGEMYAKFGRTYG